MKKYGEKNCILVRDGLANAKIVSQTESWEESRQAIMELVNGIAKSTNTRVPIDNRQVMTQNFETNKDTAVKIYFKKIKGINKDGFLISVKSSEIHFNAASESGFLNAVYTFLNKYCGFLWIWPGNYGEVYTKCENLEVPIGEICEEPAYLWRDILETDMGAYGVSKWTLSEAHMFPDEITMSQFRQWCRRNKLGGLKVYKAHTWGELINPDEYGKDHLDYFAEVNGTRENSLKNWDGKHGGQLCTTNHEVVDLMVSKVRNFFNTHPEYDAISISPNDGKGFCECDNCIKMDTKFMSFGNQSGKKDNNDYDSTFKDDTDNTAASKRIREPITDRMFTFANEIAEQIALSHPDKYLLLLVYSSYRTPPSKVKLAPNVIAQFCLQCSRYWEDDIRKADYINIETLKKSAEKVGIYEYYDQGNWPGVVRLFPELICESIKNLNKRGVRFYSTQAGTGFATNGLNLWFMARALWNPNIDVEDAMNEYCNSAFAEAADHMKSYYDLWRSKWKEFKGLSRFQHVDPMSAILSLYKMPFDQIRCLYPISFIEKCELELEKAKAAVSQSSMERKRIDFVEWGVKATRIAVEAAEVSYKLRDEGWPMLVSEVTADVVKNLGDANEVYTKAMYALSFWERWEAFIEKAKNEFVLSYFWARYCFDGRKTTHPHFALHKILEILANIK